MTDTLESLQTLVRRFGPGVLDNPNDLRCLLDDTIPEEDKTSDRHLIVEAVADDVVTKLRSLIREGANPQDAVAHAADQLVEHYGLDRISANWACATLGAALGLIPDDVQRQVSQQRRSLPLPFPGEEAFMPRGGPAAGVSPSDSAEETIDSPRPPGLFQSSPPQETIGPPRSPGFFQSLPPQETIGPPRPPGFFQTPPPAAGPQPYYSPQPSYGLPSVPAPPGPTKRRPMWLLIGIPVVLLALVLAGIGVYLFTRPAAVTPDTVAQRFSALGGSLTQGAEKCQEAPVKAGQKERFTCDFEEFPVEFTSYDSQSALQARRASVTKPQTNDLPGTVTSAGGTSVAQQLPDGYSLLYWDSTAARQSGYVRAKVPLATLKEWWNGRDITVVAFPPPPVPPKEQLLQHIPAAFRAGCGSADLSDNPEYKPGLLTALACPPSGASAPESLFYFLYKDKASMDAVFDQLTEVGEADCATNAPGRTPWRYEATPDVTVGQAACGKGGDATSYQIWTHDELHILAQIGDPKKSMADLWTWWSKNDVGPSK